MFCTQTTDESPQGRGQLRDTTATGKRQAKKGASGVFIIGRSQTKRSDRVHSDGAWEINVPRHMRRAKRSPDAEPVQDFTSESGTLPGTWLPTREPAKTIETLPIENVNPDRSLVTDNLLCFAFELQLTSEMDLPPKLGNILRSTLTNTVARQAARVLEKGYLRV